MGFSLYWLAVRGTSPGDVQDELGLSGTGTREEFPESEYTRADLQGGWSLVVANHPADLRFLRDAVLRRLSSGCDVVTCFVEEHVMSSSAGGWNGGRMTWSVTHDARQDLVHLEAVGDLPPTFESIRRRALARQDASNGRVASVDHVFEIPVELAESLTGYRHDRDLPGPDRKPFEVLVVRPSREGTPPWWKRLFGD